MDTIWVLLNLLLLLGATVPAQSLDFSTAAISRFGINRRDHWLLELVTEVPAPRLKALLQPLASGDRKSTQDLPQLIADITRLYRTLPRNTTVWPAARRAVLAALVLQRLREGALDGDAQSAAEELVVRVYRQLRGSVRARGVLQFTHIAKTGGSTLCWLAERNGVRVWGPRNCLIDEFDDFPRYYNVSFHKQIAEPGPTCPKWPYRPRNATWSCAQRKARLAERNLTAYANEYIPLDGGRHGRFCEKEMATILPVRHPQDRLLSHLTMVWRQYGIWCKDQRHVYFDNATKSDVGRWQSIAPGPLDNFYIRSLLGGDDFYLPLGGIKQAHLDAARRLAAQTFDLVLPLEVKRMWARAVRLGLGWCDVDTKACNPTKASNLSPHNEGLPREVPLFWKQRLQATNALDLKFYQYAVFLAQLDGVMYDVVDGVLGPRMCADWARPAVNQTVWCTQ
ncbi:hypothetical protein HYH03_007289 [Edaphochlamys debaryana]|uniref:Uncharacterized protein n=1 Tax=Edaphochlamys debaryana TaxID=47281 RepID=A0A835Y0S2_9CHLO|nr:hypothetical protein HYH03_007289 [Edaphochlamys debaryana]|eukprot:KAG2494522.1 hypothetical protein HYH03_007289 [Edaphochlamys debaryana]